MTRILVIDNYDSFVFTLVGYLEQLGAHVTVIRNDEASLETVINQAQEHDGIMISPGPGAPHEAGCIIELIQWAAQHHKPLLGVCLGHQAIAEAFGAVVYHAPEIMHGKISHITHNEQSVFNGLPSPLRVTRYHSLAVDPKTMPEELEATATSENGIIMALQHKTSPIHGVQFHPESVLTEGGYSMLGTWLEEVGLNGAREKAQNLSPHINS
ncbi:anthranilate synthase component II [Rothia sp. CCM 9419]|uniref:anthranilate synthase component II n=1 Tax=Rothia sp. CCM 9419 TaxID=3402662 RepID=UPI003AE7D6FF